MSRNPGRKLRRKRELARRVKPGAAGTKQLVRQFAKISGRVEVRGGAVDTSATRELGSAMARRVPAAKSPDK